MNVLNNLIYTAKNDSMLPLPGGMNHTVNAIVNDYWPNGINIDGTNSLDFPTIGTYDNSSYDPITQYSFLCTDDTAYIEAAIQKHWFDIGYHLVYSNIGYATILPQIEQEIQVYSDFTQPPYNLIYSYLIENTRIVQIFASLIKQYLNDEVLNKPNNQFEFRWLLNTENLFFKSIPNSSYRNIEGQLNPASEKTRRNAYLRLFGMDLAFESTTNETQVRQNESVKFGNKSFILLFEGFLTEFWKAYTNARNQVGSNTTDIIHLLNTAKRIQKLLMARRTHQEDFTQYRFFNLSKVEFSATIMMSWFYNIIAANTPIVKWLSCEANTAGERLLKIGEKVGVKAHRKSSNLIDMAVPMAALLRSIELGHFNNEDWIKQVIHASAGNYVPAPTADHRNVQNGILTVVNNWEEATGHRIKPLTSPKTTASVQVLSN